MSLSHFDSLLGETMTSNQKAVMALEIEARLAEEARVRQLRGLKQNGDSLRKEFPNGNDAPSGNYFPNGNDAPSGNSFIKESAALAAAEVGTNLQYVKDAKKIKALAPELLNPLRDGLITIPYSQNARAPLATAPELSINIHRRSGEIDQ